MQKAKSKVNIKKEQKSKNQKSKDVLLAKAYGFCLGVKRAIEIAKTTGEKLGPGQAFVWKDIVHNQHVVSDLEKKGVGSVKNIEEIPKGKTVIWSAHGVAPEMWNKAKNLGLNIVDATCPIVASVHKLAKEASERGDTVIYIGDEGHDEQQGVKGEVKTEFITIRNLSDLSNLRVEDPTKVTVLTQTTLSIGEVKEIIDTLKAKFPQAKIHQNICRATTERQQAVKELAREVDLVIVVGSPTSANAKRLKEVAEKEGIKAVLVDSAEDLGPEIFQGSQRIGVTAGASTPEEILEEVIEKIKTRGFNFQDTKSRN